MLCDLFDDDRGVLVEAKANADRGGVRMAIGQLKDYRRMIGSECKQLRISQRGASVESPGGPTPVGRNRLHLALWRSLQRQLG